MTVRPACPDEAGAVAALVNSAYRGESSRAGWTTEADLLAGQRTDPEAIAAILSARSQILLVAESADGRLVGCVELERRRDGVVYLGMLTVDPRLQGGGLGKRLLAEGEAYAASLFSAAVVEMTVISRRTELIAWYERRGYRRTGETAPFPAHDVRFGLPQVDDLEFVVLRKVFPGT